MTKPFEIFTAEDFDKQTLWDLHRKPYDVWLAAVADRANRILNERGGGGGDKFHA